MKSPSGIGDRGPVATLRRRHDHRRHADHGDREHHHGRRNREDPDSIAHVKLSIPKFTGREDAYAYLEWAQQCDQIFRVHNLSY